MITPRPRIGSSTTRPSASKWYGALHRALKSAFGAGPTAHDGAAPILTAAGRCAAASSQSRNRHGSRACRPHAPAQPASQAFPNPNPRLSPWRLRRAPAAAQSGAPQRTRPPSEPPSPTPCRAAQFDQAGSAWDPEMSIGRRGIPPLLQRCRFKLRAVLRILLSTKCVKTGWSPAAAAYRGQAHQADNYARHLHCPCNNMPRSR